VGHKTDCAQIVLTCGATRIGGQLPVNPASRFLASSTSGRPGSASFPKFGDAHLLPKSTLLALVFSDAYTWLAAKLRNPILNDDKTGFPRQDRLDHDEALLIEGNIVELEV